MKKLLAYRLLNLLFLCTVFSACKKNGSEVNNVPSEPLKTEQGFAIGTLTTKTIGTAGGELTTPDGKVKITIPQGAVATETTFSIQPITNTLFSEEPSRIAYRLLPEGITFNKPVQLQFKYDSSNLINTVEDAITLAWQQDNGAWKAEPASLNKATKTVLAETTHFSDWSVTGGVELKTEKDVLRANGKSKIWIVSIADADLLAPLSVTTEDEKDLTSLGNWKIIKGSGNLEPRKGGDRDFEYSATYTAPSSVTGRLNIVITMEVEGFNKIKDPSAPGGVRHSGKMILFARLIVGDNYLTGTLDGIQFGFFGDKVVATAQSGLILVRASDESGEVTVSAHVNGAGSFPCGQIIDAGKAGVSIGSPGSGTFFYIHSYVDCGQLGETKFTPSPVEITKWPAVGQTAEGSFSGPVYLSDGLCGARIKMLHLEFNIVRSN